MPDGSEIGEIRIEFIASETAISASTGEIPHQTEGVRSRTGSAWERWRRSSNFYDLALRRTACKVFLNGHVFHRVCHPPRAAPERYRRPNRVVGGRSPAYKGAIIPQVRLRAAVGARAAPRCFRAAGVGVLRRGIRTSARPWRTSTCRGHIGQSFGTQRRPNVFFRGRRTPARVRSPCKDLQNNYILINNGTINTLGYVTFSYENIENKMLMKIFMIDEFTYDVSKTYTIKYKIKDMISHMGKERLWYKAIFYHWETFNRSLLNIQSVIYQFDDIYFNKQKISRNSYIEHILSKLCNIDNCNLFESCIDTFDKQMNHDINSIDNFTTVKTLHENISNVFYNYRTKVKDIIALVARDPIAKCSWIDYIGHFICDTIDFTIDGNIVEEINDQIVHIYNNRDTDSNTIQMLYTMIGHNSILQIPSNNIMKHILYVPLPMSFKESVKALPIIALSNSKLSMSVKLKDFSKLIKCNSDIIVKAKSKIKLEINASYVFLDLELREKFARMRHEYLYEIKRCYQYTISKITDEIKLEFTGPCKEMLWFYTSKISKDSNDLWNYTNVPLKLYNPNTPLQNDYSSNDDVRQYIIKMLSVRSKYYNLDLISDKLIVNALSSSDIVQLSNYIK